MGLIRGMTTHEVSSVYSSRFGSISLSAEGFIPRLRLESACMESATVFTADLLLAPGHGLPGSGQRAALGSFCCGLPSAVAEPVEASGRRARAHAHGSGSAPGARSARSSPKPGGSTQTRVLQAMGSPGPPPWASGTMTHQHRSAKSDGLRWRHPLLIISETGGDAASIRSCHAKAMVQRAWQLTTSLVQWCKGLQPRRGPAGAGMPARLSPAPGRNTPCSRGALEALKPRIPLDVSRLSPIHPPKAAGWSGSPQTPQPQAPVPCWGTPESWGTSFPWDPQPGASPVLPLCA